MKIINFWFPLVLYSGIIFYVSSQPSLVPPIERLNVDKILHIGEYIPFGFLAARAISSLSLTISDRKVCLWAVLMTCLYGFSDEYHQLFVDNRSSDILDVIADTIGGFIGAVIFIKFSKNRAR